MEERFEDIFDEMFEVVKIFLRSARNIFGR